MRLYPTSSAILSIAGLATAMPMLDAELLQREYLNTTILDTRASTDPWHFCSDSNWRAFGERAFLAGIRLMGKNDDYSMRMGEGARSQIPDTYLGTEGMCTSLWCGGNHRKDRGVVFYLCLRSGTPNQSYNSKDLAQKFHDGFHDCNNKREPQDDPDNIVSAFHIWEKGYDLHVEGGYPNTKCPTDTKKTAFPRPPSLDWVPYTKTPKPS